MQKKGYFLSEECQFVDDAEDRVKNNYVAANAFQSNAACSRIKKINGFVKAVRLHKIEQSLKFFKQFITWWRIRQRGPERHFQEI